MRNTNRFILAGLAAFLFLASPALSLGDLYWESEQVTQGLPGQKDATRTVKNYITPDASRTDMGDQVMIMDYKTMTMYSINPADKSYSKVDMTKIGIPGQGKMDPKEAAQAQEMIKKMFGQIKVVPTTETKTISGYKCKKYDVDFMMVKTEYWTSKDVKGYNQVKEVSKKMQKAFSNNPILKNTDIMGMMDSLDGFPVQIVNRMMGGTSTTTLSKVEEKSLPKSLFQVPAGYTEKELTEEAPPMHPPASMPKSHSMPPPTSMPNPKLP